MPTQVQADIQIKSVSPGSVDISIFTEVAAAVAPLAPKIFDQAWLLYKSAYDLIGIMTRYYKENGVPMGVNVQDSKVDGPLVNVTDNGNAVVVNGNIILAASNIYKKLSGYHDMVDSGLIDELSISNKSGSRLLFNRQNHQDYQALSDGFIEKELVVLKCSIVRFNKRSLAGTLDIHAGGTSMVKPFVALPEILEDCIDAFKASTVYVSAKKEVEVNALGETSVIRYHVESISLFEKGI
jgi:hypothetical protein